MSETEPFIETALAAADEAATVIRRFFHTQVPSEKKDDISPIVTEADRAAERAIRQILKQAFPGHAVYGEEEGYEAGTEPYEWILDPIDGTIAFSCGKPVFATLIALCRDGEPILGIIDQPVAGHRWVGAKNRPTLFNGQPCRTSDVAALQDARFSTTAPEMFHGDYEDTLRSLRHSCWVTSYGGDAYAYGLLASGHVELIIERGLKRHDIAALLPVVSGAGGIITDLAGVETPRLTSCTDETVYDTYVSANLHLHEQVLQMIAETG